MWWLVFYYMTDDVKWCVAIAPALKYLNAQMNRAERDGCIGYFQWKQKIVVVFNTKRDMDNFWGHSKIAGYYTQRWGRCIVDLDKLQRRTGHEKQRKGIEKPYGR